MPGVSSLRDIAHSFAGAAASSDWVELHGGICGGICAAGIEGARSWTDAWFETLAGDIAQRTGLRETVEALVSDAWRALSGSALVFEPLLPDEDASIEDRVDALAIWCHGFLSGIALAGVSREWLESRQADPEDEGELAEVLDDFAEISRATVQADDREQEAQAGFDFATLVEHVRVGTLLAYEALTEHRGSESRSIH